MYPCISEYHTQWVKLHINHTLNELSTGLPLYKDTVHLIHDVMLGGNELHTNPFIMIYP